MLKYFGLVSLGPFDLLHADLARQWRNNREVWQWCRQNSLISYPEQLRWFEHQSLDQSIKMFSINSDTDGFVGVCGLTSIDHINSRAEFSLYIAPEFQGKGYGRIALKTLLVHAFHDLGLNCVWGETFDGNPAAKMFEGLGFKKEGTRREFYFKNGKRIDAHLYSILRGEFVWP
jgi:diamine N-acetyltransferase